MVVKITEKEIYNKLTRLEESNARQHFEIMDLLKVSEAKVNKLQWAIGGVAFLALTTLGWFISFIIKFKGG